LTSDLPSLTVVIVNYNAGDELRAALQSVAATLSGRAWEAIVIDNASTDGSAAIAGEFSSAFGDRVRLVRNPANIGFGRAVNQGVVLARAALVLLLNPDCRVEPGAIDTLRDALAAHPSCAIAGPRILDPDGSVQGSARGDPDMLTGLFGRTSALRRLLPGLAVSTRNVVNEDPLRRGGPSGPPDARTVDWLSGACMLARREALTSVGGFDERYFLYWEDADLCRRLRGRGFDVRYVPDATAIHRVGQSSRTARAASIRAFHDSAYLYYATHVASGALNPKRWLARLLLWARCRWQLRRVI
jgi:GT2 family glycosyltransferase